jgi:hypothetical protein
MNSCHAHLMFITPWDSLCAWAQNIPGVEEARQPKLPGIKT